MEQLVDDGLVLSIGVQDADIDDVTAVMEYARITPAVNSLEVHPGNRNDALLAFCRSQVNPVSNTLCYSGTLWAAATVCCQIRKGVLGPTPQSHCVFARD